jgi:hypothetical protein
LRGIIGIGRLAEQNPAHNEVIPRCADKNDRVLLSFLTADRIWEFQSDLDVAQSI